MFESTSSGTNPSSSAVGKTCSYKLTSTVMLYMSKSLSSSASLETSGDVNLGGSMTRQVGPVPSLFVLDAAHVTSLSARSDRSARHDFLEQFDVEPH